MFTVAKDDNDLILQIAAGLNPLERELDIEYVNEYYERGIVRVDGYKISLKKI